MGTKSLRSAGAQYNPRGVTQGTTLVDPNTGLPVDVLEDDKGVRRLAIDASFSGTIENIDIDLDIETDGVHIGNPATGDVLLVEPDGSVNVNTEVDAADGDNIAISSHPPANQIFAEAADTLTTANFEEIFTFTSTDDTTRLMRIEATSETICVFQVKINGVIKRVKRTSTAERNVTVDFLEHRQLTNGDTLTVEAKIETKDVTSYNTFTSLEGYLA